MEKPADKLENGAPGKTILVVEDDKTIRESFSFALSYHGYTVHTATSGREALRQLRLVHPDLILLDLLMPEMSGFDFLRAIRRFKLSIPIFVLSNLGSGTDVEIAKELGATDMILKSSMTPGQVVELVSQQFDNSNHSSLK